jgi:hypothetical protein
MASENYRKQPWKTIRKGEPIDEAQPVTTLSLAIKEARAAATIKVRVNKPYRVIHKGKVFLGGRCLLFRMMMSIPAGLPLVGLQK